MDTMQAFNHTYANYGLKSGIVLTSYETTDDQNITKATVEYDVAVFEQADDGGQNSIVYKNCVAADLFGGIGDFFEFRRREQMKVDGSNNERVAAKQDGAIVLLLCLTGSSDKAIIVGALPHPARTTGLTEDAGVTLLGEFNGISFTIDKTGALKIGFKGSTGNDGTPDDSSVGGTYMQIEKDGSTEISDGKGETLRLDKTKGTADLKSTKAMSFTTGDALNTTSTAATSMTMADWMVKASGSATLSVKSLDLKSDAAININGSSVTVKADGMVMVQGSKITLDGLTYVGGAGGSPALTLSTNFLGIGNMGAPVISTAIGPFSSKVFIAS
jgi:hypothetical protein